MCQDCHSPRDEAGAFVRAQWLAGAAVGFSPLAAMPWAEVAPPIAGLPTMSHQQGVRFLMSGERPDGSHPRPPMPEYRFSQEDAEAVVEYLRSLMPPE
jgi:mono/diheme cytochrome c family protein